MSPQPKVSRAYIFHLASRGKLQKHNYDCHSFERTFNVSEVPTVVEEMGEIEKTRLAYRPRGQVNGGILGVWNKTKAFSWRQPWTQSQTGRQSHWRKQVDRAETLSTQQIQRPETTHWNGFRAGKEVVSGGMENTKMWDKCKDNC